MLAVMACPEQRLPRNAARPVRVAVLGAGGGMAGSGRGPTPDLDVWFAPHPRHSKRRLL